MWVKFSCFWLEKYLGSINFHGYGSVVGTIIVRFAKYASYYGLIFVDKRHTTKSRNPWKFIYLHNNTVFNCVNHEDSLQLSPAACLQYLPGISLCSDYSTNTIYGVILMIVIFHKVVIKRICNDFCFHKIVSGNSHTILESVNSHCHSLWQYHLVNNRACYGS